MKTVSTDIMRDFLFGSDCAHNTGTELDIQHSSEGSQCQTISTKKTGLLHQPAPGKPDVESNTTVNFQILNTVSKLACLVSTL